MPQGSVLGPLLFLIYTIDLPHACTNTNTTCSQFADDTALITSTSSLQTTQQQLQKSVSSAGRWLKDWHLLVNAEKSVTVIFHHDNRPPAQQPTIHLDGKLLSVARKQHHLGITFQHDLRWTELTNAILNKSLISLENILRLRNSLNSSTTTTTTATATTTTTRLSLKNRYSLDTTRYNSVDSLSTVSESERIPSATRTLRSTKCW